MTAEELAEARRLSGEVVDQFLHPKQVVTDEQALMLVCPKCESPVDEACTNVLAGQVHAIRRKRARVLIWGDANAKKQCSCLNRKQHPKTKYESEDAAARWLRTLDYDKIDGRAFKIFQCPTERSVYHVTTIRGEWFKK